MPHVALIAMSGVRVREAEMLALGMSLPGLRQRAGAVAALPALGLLTLGAMVPDDWGVSYHEVGSAGAEARDAVVQEVVGAGATVAAISALTASILEAYALSAALRAAGVKVVIGGLHATALPEEAALHADAVVVGDGEPVWVEVLRDAAAGRLRCVYRASAPFDLAESPLPRFELLGKKERARYTVQTARGCPLACDFCAASRMLGPFRVKPAQRIAAELAAITNVRPRATIELADDNTFAGRAGREDMLDVLAASGVRYFTECDWRLGERPEVLARLAASGCVQVLVGMESMVHSYAGMGAKRSPLPRIMEAVERIQESGVAVIGCFVVGADGEDAESMQALGEFLLGAPFADVQLTVQTPFPGSPLFSRLRGQGRLLVERDWSSYTLFDVTYRPDRLSVDELERGFRSLVKYTFAEGPSARRAEIRRKIWGRRGVAS